MTGQRDKPIRLAGKLALQSHLQWKHVAGMRVGIVDYDEEGYCGMT